MTEQTVDSHIFEARMKVEMAWTDLTEAQRVKLLALLERLELQGAQIQELSQIARERTDSGDLRQSPPQ